MNKSTIPNSMDDSNAPREKPIIVINVIESSLGILNWPSLGSTKTQQPMIEPAIINNLREERNETKLVRCDKTVDNGSVM